MEKQTQPANSFLKYGYIGILLILTLSGLWILYTSRQVAAEGAAVLQAPQVGFHAPDAVISDADGNDIPLSSFRGKPVLLNIWASWCPPCRAEMPAMDRVYQEYKDDGFVVLAVNSTIQDNPDDARDFYNELGLSFGLYFDHYGNATRAYQVRSLPTSYFISADGIIQEVIIGGPMAEALLVTRVEKLIGDEY